MPNTIHKQTQKVVYHGIINIYRPFPQMSAILLSSFLSSSSMFGFFLLFPAFFFLRYLVSPHIERLMEGSPGLNVD